MASESSRPRSPVQAFACPELIIIALTRPKDSLRRLMQISTQEALTAELVKKPVKILLGGDKISARSFALET